MALLVNTGQTTPVNRGFVIYVQSFKNVMIINSGLDTCENCNFTFQIC